MSCLGSWWKRTWYDQGAYVSCKNFIVVLKNSRFSSCLSIEVQIFCWKSIHFAIYFQFIQFVSHLQCLCCGFRVFSTTLPFMFMIWWKRSVCACILHLFGQYLISYCNLVLLFYFYSGRGVWRCLYDPHSSLLVTAGFDSSIKVHLHKSSKGLEVSKGEEDFVDRKETFTLLIPNSSEHVDLMDR